MSDARDEILGRLRDGLGRAPLGPALPWEMGPDAFAPGAPRDLDTEQACRERFREMLERAGGHYHAAADEADATRIVEKICHAYGARHLLVSDHRATRIRAEELADHHELIPHDAAREELFACELGLTAVQWAVAETGTLVLLSAAEHHRLASLLPPVHVAFLESRCILASLEELMDAVGSEDPEEVSRTITMITGPSRTADIELDLVTGMHGPRELHVVVL